MQGSDDGRGFARASANLGWTSVAVGMSTSFWLPAALDRTRLLRRWDQRLGAKKELRERMADKGVAAAEVVRNLEFSFRVVDELSLPPPPLGTRLSGGEEDVCNPACLPPAGQPLAWFDMTIVDLT